MPEDIARGRAAGFSDYWTKPIDFKQFVSSLERLFPLDVAAGS
jgi:CheY-like chemotaxis protein